MMKIIAILISNLILIQSLNINLESFAKLNVLLEHAQFHQEKYGDSLFEFLYEHYGDKDLLAANNHDEHEDLPFKECTHNFNHSISVFDFKVDVFELKNNIVLNLKPTYFYKDSYSFYEKSAIFQPPKYS